jgi:hypothetical protein
MNPGASLVIGCGDGMIVITHAFGISGILGKSVKERIVGSPKMMIEARSLAIRVRRACARDSRGVISWRSIR